MLLGALTALFAVGLALVFRANRIVNFAQGDLGAVPRSSPCSCSPETSTAGRRTGSLASRTRLRFLMGLVAAILLGFIVERTFINRFNRGPRLILTVATIGIAQLLTAFALFMPGWFGLGGSGSARPVVNPPFDVSIEIGGVFFDDNDLMVFIVVPILLAALTIFMRYTRVGIAVRAAAARADRAATLGVPIGRIQSIVWVIATVLAFVTVFMRAGVVGIPLGSAFGVLVLVRALAAAVIGRMDDFARIAAAALGIGIVEQAIVFETGRDLYVFPVLFVIVVGALMLARPRDRGSRVEDQEVSTWQAAREVRPIPTELRSLPIVRNTQIALYAAVALFILTLPMWLGDSKLLIATATGIIAIIAISLVLLTGWAGHVSLGQLAFAAVGGAVGAYVTQDQGWDLFFAFVLGGLAGAALAVVIGIPAARAGGITLAVTTLALAPAVLYWLLNPEFFDWVPRGGFRTDPELFGRIEIKSQTSFYFLTLALLAIAIAIAYGIRRTRTGRVLDRAAREPAGRGVVRHQRAPHATRRVRDVRLPRRDRGRDVRPPPAHDQPVDRREQPVLGRGKSPGLLDRRDRRSRLDPRCDPRHDLRVRDAVLHARRVPVPRHWNRAVADPLGAARWPRCGTRRGPRRVPAVDRAAPQHHRSEPPRRPPRREPRRFTRSRRGHRGRSRRRSRTSGNRRSRGAEAVRRRAEARTLHSLGTRDRAPELVAARASSCRRT